jgi:hypothetical protein
VKAQAFSFKPVVQINVSFWEWEKIPRL